MNVMIRWGLSVCGILVVAGCVENGVGAAPASGPSPAAAGATLALDLRNPSEARESVFGDAVLFTAPGMGLALALDGGTQPGMQDGYVDQVFILQQQTPAELQPRRLASAELFYAGRMLMARSSTDRLAWMVGGAGDADPQVDRLPFPAAGAERFVGFGMSRRTGAWQVRLEDATGASMNTLLPACAAGTGSGIATICDSGGVGSTSCSTTCGITQGSCSTVCGTGYYACCNRTPCTCACVAGGGAPRPPY